jgi:hypothetical protein
MLRQTVDNYHNIFSSSLQGLHNIKSLFQNSIPVLLDRINCFPMEHINRVHEHNMKKVAERLLQEKLNKHKHKRKRPGRPASPPPINEPTWSPQQIAIINAVSAFLDAFVDWKNGRKSKPKPLSILLFGGPGVGKTTVLRHLTKLCKDAKMPLICSAATGVAAGAMLDAGTNHAKYALPVFAGKEIDGEHFLPPLSKMTVKMLMEEYDDSLADGIPLAIAVDEVSMVSALTFGRMLNRIKEFEADYFDSVPPRLFILVGKLYLS